MNLKQLHLLKSLATLIVAVMIGFSAKAQSVLATESFDKVQSIELTSDGSCEILNIRLARLDFVCESTRLFIV